MSVRGFQTIYQRYRLLKIRLPTVSTTITINVQNPYFIHSVKSSLYAISISAEKLIHNKKNNANSNEYLLKCFINN